MAAQEQEHSMIAEVLPYTISLPAEWHKWLFQRNGNVMRIQCIYIEQQYGQYKILENTVIHVHFIFAISTTSSTWGTCTYTGSHVAR
jgi:hypothetical protein